ncbi:methyltransferase [Trypanosoma rangeli]|uniref:Methyltransferase n=1 Tax=Trypanosoma rangeli TaxID=5698 RepID=A0A422N5K5_TRYRA|nr:methyltransferase [Trypanosoma rangeli]RNF00745.1 methyltransferase [Trypanosoma rangeli]|eukprot:RNF00745.1 methyltransferase [Trypanosoma rangeli]
MHATGASLTQGDRMELRRSAVVLNALATPVVGQLVQYGLTAMAYVGYGIGRVSFYTRQSIAPPLSSLLSSIGTEAQPVVPASTLSASVQHLIEMRAYEQAAAAATAGVGGNSSSAFGSVEVPRFRGILHGKALVCLYVDPSPIHNRGLITTRDLPRGTRIITEPQRSYMDAANFVPLLADTHARLPDTWHYTTPFRHVVGARHTAAAASSHESQLRSERLQQPLPWVLSSPRRRSPASPSCLTVFGASRTLRIPIVFSLPATCRPGVS